MKKLRICMITCEFPTDCAGIGNDVCTMSKALIAPRHNVLVLKKGKYFCETRRNVSSAI